MIYKIYSSENDGAMNAVIQIFDDGRVVSFLFDPDNTDYQAYLAWIAEGNTPQPAEEGN